MKELPPGTLGLPPLPRHLDQVCDRFEAAWNEALAGGPRPRLGDFLAGVAGPELQTLVLEMLALEAHFRRQLGETPSPEEYQQRFPQLPAEWVAQELTSRTEVRVVPEPVGEAKINTVREEDSTPTASKIRCPHCHSPIQLAKESDEVLCPGCGSSFRLRDAQATETASGMKQLGRFQLLERLGLGAFGAVWKARDTELDRIVALKIPHTGLLTAKEELERFQREARAAAQLRHPNIVSVHEVTTLNGLPVIVAEYVPGVPLKDLLEVRRLTFRQTAALIAQLADALEYAHSLGVVHRDIKPANLMLLRGGSAKNNDLADVGKPMILDFGLALRDTIETTMTMDGQLLAPAYMSPEQAAGQSHQADRRSDVYSLGVVLYQLLTSELPFRGSRLMLLDQVLHEEPRAPRKINDKIPRDLETICLKCLQKEPHKRDASALELAEDLRRYQTGEPIAARPVGRVERAAKWARRNPAVAALLLVTVLGVVSIVWKYLDAKQQKNIALNEADKAKKARDFLVGIFRLSTDIQGRNITARQIVADAEKRIPVEFADQPGLRADLEAAIEEVNRNIRWTLPAALILEARGSIRIDSVRGAASRPAVPQVLLFPEDRLALGGDAHLRLCFLRDLHQEWLKPGREVILGQKGCEPADAVTEQTPDILMTFVRLRKGTFYMGWDGQNKGTKTEIEEDFEIAVHTATQGQWQAVMGNYPSCFCARGTYGRNSVLGISDEELKLFPVESVSWEDAQKFIKKLNEKERGSGFLYRLPTKKEWEYACRGGAISEEECSYHYYFAKPTNDLSSEQANFNGTFPSGMAPKGEYLYRPTRVGAYPPNKLGLCDMHGNVWQWCADLEGSNRVIRGGNWYDGGSYCRAAARAWSPPSARPNNVGFRLARVPRPLPAQQARANACGARSKGLRSSDALDNLPEAERAAWRKLWGQVAAVLDKTARSG